MCVGSVTETKNWKFRKQKSDETNVHQFRTATSCDMELNTTPLILPWNTSAGKLCHAPRVPLERSIPSLWKRTLNPTRRHQATLTVKSKSARTETEGETKLETYPSCFCLIPLTFTQPTLPMHTHRDQSVGVVVQTTTDHIKTPTDHAIYSPVCNHWMSSTRLSEK